MQSIYNEALLLLWYCSIHCKKRKEKINQILISVSSSNNLSNLVNTIVNTKVFFEKKGENKSDFFYFWKVIKTLLVWKSSNEYAFFVKKIAFDVVYAHTIFISFYTLCFSSNKCNNFFRTSLTTRLHHSFQIKQGCQLLHC